MSWDMMDNDPSDKTYKIAKMPYLRHNSDNTKEVVGRIEPMWNVASGIVKRAIDDGQENDDQPVQDGIFYFIIFRSC